MTTIAPSEILARILSMGGLPYQLLVSSCAEVVLFGSRAAQLSHVASDWDVLFLAQSDARLPRVRTLDAVVISNRHVAVDGWLGHELAGHCWAHGVWLKGERSWDAAALNFEVAAQTKRRRCYQRSVALHRGAELLPAYTMKRFVDLYRREIQRQILLSDGIPVPPTSSLDSMWTTLATRQRVCRAASEFIPPRASTAQVERVFALLQA